MKKRKVVLGQYYTSEEVADFMVSLSTKPKTARVLDSGCGQGVFIRSLLKDGFTNVKGIDIDDENCRIARNRFGDRIEIECIDYLRTPKGERFDLIIGNPPYVHWNNIQEDVRTRLQDDSFWEQYSNGEWDLLYAFITWSIEKLKENGELIYIVPYNWFNSTYGASLRRYLIDNGRFEVICHFGEFKLFKDCYPNNIIFRYRKTRSRGRSMIFVSEFKGRKGRVSQLLEHIKREFDRIDHQRYESEDDEFRIFTTSQFKTENLWHLATPTEKKRIERIERATRNVRLKDYLHVGVGIVSGFDEAFISDKWQDSKLSRREKELVFPFIKAKNCRRYFIENGSNYILADSIKSEEELKGYPGIYQRLSRHREGLENRYIAKKKQWWNWATIRNKALFERSLSRPKIFVPCVDRSLKSRYSYTTERYFGAGDVLLIAGKSRLREDMRYVLAWLNSSMINDWYRIKGSHTGHRIRYTQSYVSQIPLRLINWDDIEEVGIYNQILGEVDRILENKGDNEAESRIDGLFELLIEKG